MYSGEQNDMLRDCSFYQKICIRERKMVTVTAPVGGIFADGGC